ncbi:hypothetical protein PAMA_010840 [Pampus argenteus]
MQRWRSPDLSHSTGGLSTGLWSQSERLEKDMRRPAEFPAGLWRQQQRLDVEQQQKGRRYHPLVVEGEERRGEERRGEERRGEERRGEERRGEERRGEERRGEEIWV